MLNKKLLNNLFDLAELGLEHIINLLLAGGVLNVVIDGFNQLLALLVEVVLDRLQELPLLLNVVVVHALHFIEQVSQPLLICMLSKQLKVNLVSLQIDDLSDLQLELLDPLDELFDPLIGPRCAVFLLGLLDEVADVPELVELPMQVEFPEGRQHFTSLVLSILAELPVHFQELHIATESILTHFHEREVEEPQPGLV